MYAFLDDLNLGGDASQVGQAWDLIVSSGERLGLFINMEKCEVYSREEHDMRDYPEEVRRYTDPNMVILGSPIGESQFLTRHVESLIETNKKLLARIEDLHDPQIALHLLRSCASFNKLVHIARTTPVDVNVERTLATFDEDVLDCFQRACGVVVSEDAAEQVRLSLARGGLGLRSVSRHHSSAYMASYVKVLPENLNEKIFTDAHKN